MTMANVDAMQVRLDVLSLALAALARAVPADLAAGIQESLRREVAKRLDGVALSPQADEVVAADLGRLMSALGARAA